jgi:hypothetical protein
MAKPQEAQQDSIDTAPAPETGASTIVEALPEITPISGPKKSTKTGNLILDIAHEVEQMTKGKALNEADKLAENIEVNYFKLGGVLKLINDNGWFEGYSDFDGFVYEKYGFQGRKARYLVSIYDNLVSKQIPWEKVSHLGWTKLKDLAPILTPDNVDEWVAKAEKCTVKELQALLAANQNDGGETTQKTTDEVVKMSFKFKPDQADVVSQAIAKAKGELHTEFDTVALENICSGFVGGNSTVTTSFSDQVKTMGFEPALGVIAGLFPEWDINASPAEPSKG